MALVRWSPETNLTMGYNAYQRPFSPMMNPFVNPFTAGTPLEQTLATTLPLVDVIDQNNEFIVKAEVPGVDPTSLKIMVTNNILTLRGERLLEREERSENYFWVERSGGAFQRSITLPVAVEPTQVSAFCDNGILTVRLPKSQEAKTVEIGIQGGVGRYGKQTNIRTGSAQSSPGKAGGRRSKTRVH